MIKFCVACQIELKCETTGVLIISMDNDNDPCAIYSADMFYCPNCRRQQLGGHSEQAVAVGLSDCLNYVQGSKKQKYLYWLDKKEKRRAASHPVEAWEP